MILGLSVFVFLPSSVSLAVHEVELQGSGGTDISGIALSYFGSQNPEVNSSVRGWNWNVSFDHTVTKVSDSEMDRTSKLDGGLGYAGWAPFKLGGDASYSTTPAENLRAVGGRGYLSYTITRSAPPQLDQDDDDHSELDKAPASFTFLPWMTLRLAGGHEVYASSSSGTSQAGRRRGGSDVSGTASLSIAQTRYEVSATVAPWAGVSFQGGYTWYIYSESVAAFLTRLDSIRFLQTNAAGLAAETSGFPEASATFAVSVSVFEDWTPQVEIHYARQASDGSNERGVRLSLDWDLATQWSLAASVERNIADSGNTHLVTLGATYRLD